MREILPPPLQQVERTWVLDAAGHKLAYFAGCDYFRLSSHPRLVRAMERTVRRAGASVSASRATTGNHVLYENLETELARYFEVESAVLTANGYSTNLAVAQTLQGRITVALIDERAHSSLRDAARLLQCPVLAFRHREPADLSRVVGTAPSGDGMLVLTDGMFPQTGSLAPLQAYQRILPRTALILLDDAHSAGLHGRSGQGTPEVEGIGRARLIQTITLSKAFGAYGGAVLGPKRLTSSIKRHAGVFSGSTPIPLPCAAAAREALRLLRSGSSMRRRLFANARLLRGVLRSGGLDVLEEANPILSVRPRRSSDVPIIQGQLRKARIYPPYVRYGREGALGYFRFVLSSEHTRQQIIGLGEVLVQLRARLVPLV